MIHLLVFLVLNFVLHPQGKSPGHYDIIGKACHCFEPLSLNLSIFLQLISRLSFSPRI